MVTGTFSAGFGFRHADGREYGSPHARAARSAVMAEAFAALRGLGFRETETRQMLDGVRSELSDEAQMPDVVRLALRRTQVQCGIVREEAVPYLRSA